MSPHGLVSVRQPTPPGPVFGTDVPVPAKKKTLIHTHAQRTFECAGVATAYLEERFSPGINFVMSAELDHFHSNYKFGFGVVAGE